MGNGVILGAILTTLYRWLITQLFDGNVGEIYCVSLCEFLFCLFESFDLRLKNLQTNYFVRKGNFWLMLIFCWIKAPFLCSYDFYLLNFFTKYTFFTSTRNFNLSMVVLIFYLFFAEMVLRWCSFRAFDWKKSCWAQSTKSFRKLVEMMTRLDRIFGWTKLGLLEISILKLSTWNHGKRKTYQTGA